MIASSYGSASASVHLLNFSNVSSHRKCSQRIDWDLIRPRILCYKFLFSHKILLRYRSCKMCVWRHYAARSIIEVKPLNNKKQIRFFSILFEVIIKNLHSNDPMIGDESQTFHLSSPWIEKRCIICLQVLTFLFILSVWIWRVCYRKILTK